MATKVILEAWVREEAVDEAKAFFQSVIPATRIYDGCLQSCVLQDGKDPNLLIMMEEWESEDHHRRYLDWCVKTGKLRELIRFLSGPPCLRYFYTFE